MWIDPVITMMDWRNIFQYLLVLCFWTVGERDLNRTKRSESDVWFGPQHWLLELFASISVLSLVAMLVMLKNASQKFYNLLLLIEPSLYVLPLSSFFFQVPKSFNWWRLAAWMTAAFSSYVPLHLPWKHIYVILAVY